MGFMCVTQRRTSFTATPKPFARIPILLNQPDKDGAMSRIIRKGFPLRV